MRIFYNSGHEEVSYADFMDRLIAENLRWEFGVIKSAWILERKRLSNKGNALEGQIECDDGMSIQFNIGQNPIGDGYKNYLPFLKEMKCRRVGWLYVVSSLEGKRFGFLETRGVHKIIRGYFTQDGFYSLRH